MRDRDIGCCSCYNVIEMELDLRASLKGIDKNRVFLDTRNARDRSPRAFSVLIVVLRLFE